MSADNTRVDTQEDRQFEEVENALRYERRKKEVKEKLMKTVTEYYTDARAKFFGYDDESAAKRKELKMTETRLQWSISEDRPRSVGDFPAELYGRYAELIDEYLDYQIESARKDVASGNGAGSHWTFYVGLGASSASEVYFSRYFGTWMGKNYKIYDQRWGGNGSVGGKHKFARRISDKFSSVGKSAGILGMIMTGFDYHYKRITGYELLIEGASGAISTLGKIYGTAWGVGWESGRYITQQAWYQKAKFQLFYKWWQSQYGVPSYENRYMWDDFFENYKP
jgi:hypothetical protein